MNQPRSGCLGLALIVTLVLLGLSIGLNLILSAGTSNSIATVSNQVRKFEESVLVPSKDRGEADKIAVIYLRGMISSFEAGSFGDTAVDDIKLQLRQAGDDERVKAVVLYIDSPGGEVTASDMIYAAVKKFREEKKKPVVVFMGSLAASGGYYAACAGDHLVASETTFTGSIGVIIHTLKYKGLFEKVGLESVIFKSGQFKDMLGGSRDMTEEEREYVQKMIMQTYDKFVGIVAKERKLPEDQLRNGIADGRVVSGKDALEAKLVDQVGYVEDAYAKAVELSKAKNPRIIRYAPPFALGRFFRLLGSNEGTGKVEIDLKGLPTSRLEPGKAYYLPSLLTP